MTCDFKSFLNCISVKSGEWEGENERLFAMEPRLRLEIFLPPAGLEIRTAIYQKAST